MINYKKKGCIDISKYTKDRVIILGDIGQINRLIDSSSAVCVVTSQVGFEGLIYNKEVHVFGSPFYSGLGLTIDHAICNGRKNKAACTLEQLVFKSIYGIFAKKICLPQSS